MLSNAQSKYIRSLSLQKYRKQYKVFIAEGDKIAREWLSSDQQINMIVATEDWLAENTALLQAHQEAEVATVTTEELQKVSTLQTPNKVLLVVPYPDAQRAEPAGWCIALNQVQDPGNLGTIIRIADWFGIDSVICSPDCVDFYNPKVVQSAMGGHLRVKLMVKKLPEFMQQTSLPVYAATLGGTNVYDVGRQAEGVLLIGNESKGLPDELVELCDNTVTIPRSGGAESLNAGVSAGILIALLKGS